MNFIKTGIEGVVIIEPKLFNDARGYFFESFSQREFDEAVRRVRFVQDNESRSSRGVVRGLHFQKPPFAQSKLVRVISGAVLDVAVDIRFSDIRQVRCRGTFRRESPSGIHSPGFRSRFQRAD